MQTYIIKPNFFNYNQLIINAVANAATNAVANVAANVADDAATNAVASNDVSNASTYGHDCTCTSAAAHSATNNDVTIDASVWP